MTAGQLAEWANLAEAATHGPWVQRHAHAMSVCVDLWPWDIVADVFQADADAAFIAAARDAVPALVAEVRRLQAELAAVPVGAIRHMRDFTVNCAVAGSIEWQSSFVVTEWLIDNVEGAA